MVLHSARHPACIFSNHSAAAIRLTTVELVCPVGISPLVGLRESGPRRRIGLSSTGQREGSFHSEHRACFRLLTAVSEEKAQSHGNPPTLLRCIRSQSAGEPGRPPVHHRAVQSNVVDRCCFSIIRALFRPR